MRGGSEYGRLVGRSGSKVFGAAELASGVVWVGVERHRDGTVALTGRRWFDPFVQQVRPKLLSFHDERRGRALTPSTTRRTSHVDDATSHAAAKPFARDSDSRDQHARRGMQYG